MKKITGEFRIADSQDDIFTSVDGPPPSEMFVGEHHPI